MSNDSPRPDPWLAAALEPQVLAALAKSVEGGDPIAWADAGVDPDLAFALVAGQISEMFRGYADAGLPLDRQMAICLGAVVKLTVENFVLHQRLEREGLEAKLAELEARRRGDSR